jgi:tetratricopeptide (TPR) repeat protein
MGQVIRIANRRKIAVLMTTLPTNLRDIPPGVSLHHVRLTARRLSQWEDYFAEAGKLESKGNYPGAGWAYERAVAIDPTYAELQFRAAKNYEKLGEFAKAKAAYAASRDYDGRPYRATSGVNEAVRKLAEEHHLIFADTNAALERLSPHGIIGRELIYDNVHPTVGAQQIIADEILRALERRGQPLPAADWQWKALEKAREDTSREEWKVDGNLNAYRYILRGLYLWENRYYPEAVVDLEKGLELMPSYLDSYVFLGDCYFRLGRREEAREAFQRLFEKDPDLLQFLLKKYPDINDSYSKITYGS